MTDRAAQPHKPAKEAGNHRTSSLVRGYDAHRLRTLQFPNELDLPVQIGKPPERVGRAWNKAVDV